MVLRFDHDCPKHYPLVTWSAADVPAECHRQYPCAVGCLCWWFVAILLQVKDAQKWINLHLAHLMCETPAEFTLEQHNSCERLHLTATYIIDVSWWVGNKATSLSDKNLGEHTPETPYVASPSCVCMRLLAMSLVCSPTVT
jgi:hypothetical protein